MASLARTVRSIVVAGAVATSGLMGSTALDVVFDAPAFAQPASSIIVRGNQRIEADTIRAYFQAGPGEALTPARIDEGVKALIGAGIVRDVRVTREGGRVVVTVVENEIINRIAFEGNRRVRTEQLQSEIESRARGTFSRATVQSDVQRLYDVYRRTGRYDVEITPKTIAGPNGRVDLVFEINEGRKAGVRSITFNGLNAFGRQRLLDVMSTGETGILSWLRSNDIYDADRLNADQEAIRRLYLRNGYVDMRIVSARADFDRAANAFVITIDIEEGAQYRVGSVEVISNIRDVDAATLRGVVRTQPGAVYNVELVDRSLEDITLAAARRGYAFATVRPRGERDSANRTVNLVYVVEEGPRVYVERINIRGNTRTMDQVIRREFDMAEGDAYNRVLVDRAERRLRNTQFFKSVKVSPEPGSSPDRVIVNVDVEDQATGNFSVSGGFSTLDGFIAEASVEERNFLGRGQFVRVGGTFGQRSQGINFSFTEPFFLDQRLSGGFDLFYRLSRRSSFQAFESTSYGATLRLGVPITENFAIQTRYSALSQRISVRDDFANCFSAYNNQLTRYTYADGTFRDFAAGDPRIPAGSVNQQLLYNVNGVASTTVGPNPWTCLNDGEVSVAIRDINNRQRFISMLGYSLIYSDLDRPVNPTTGTYAEFRQDVAGIGGDARYLRTSGEVRYYHDLTNEIVGQLRLQAGNMTGFANRGSVNGISNGRLDAIDQFFMGPELVRGFQASGIGPRDFASAATGLRTPDSIGGTNYWGASAEVTFPISILPRDFGMRGALYADAGAVWGYDSTRNLVTSRDVNGNPLTSLPVCTRETFNPVGNVCTGRDSAAHYLRSSVGVGLLWNSPFGPIRFDYSFVLAKAPWDRTQFFRFSGGGRF